MFYIPENLFINKNNIEKVHDILREFETDIGENVEEEHNAALQAIKDLGEAHVYREILRQLG